MFPSSCCLNPYYTGILYTRFGEILLKDTNIGSLNPYYTGILYTRTILIFYYFVNILCYAFLYWKTILERFKSLYITSPFCLNPYYTGILYTRKMYQLKQMAFYVLILIILEYYIRVRAWFLP